MSNNSRVCTFLIVIFDFPLGWKLGRALVASSSIASVEISEHIYSKVFLDQFYDLILL